MLLPSLAAFVYKLNKRAEVCNLLRESGFDAVQAGVYLLLVFGSELE